MLPTDVEARKEGFDLIKQVLGARGEMTAEDDKRMREVAQLFEASEVPTADQIPIRRGRK
jgi:hypothetical protein